MRKIHGKPSTPLISIRFNIVYGLQEIDMEWQYRFKVKSGGKLQFPFNAMLFGIVWSRLFFCEFVS